MGNADSKKKTDGDKSLSKGAPSTSTFSGTQAKREQICGEILSTEETYIRGLTTLDRYYRTGLVTCGVKEKELGQIFSTVPLILALHNDKVLPQLQLRCTPTAPAKSRWCVAQVFLDFLDQYPLYSNFINNYETALDRVAKLRKKKKQVDEVFDNAKGLKETNGLDFFSLFITIVQRLPRYVLLLQDLLRNIPPSEKERKLLSRAIAILSQAADDINARKAAFETQAELALLDDTVSGLPCKLAQHGRTIVETGEIAASQDADKKGEGFKPAKYWLFNDSILVARAHDGLMGALLKPWRAIHFSRLLDSEFKIQDGSSTIIHIETSRDKPLRIDSPPHGTSEFIGKLYTARSQAPKSFSDVVLGRAQSLKLSSSSGPSSSRPASSSSFHR